MPFQERNAGSWPFQHPGGIAGDDGTRWHPTSDDRAVRHSSAALNHDPGEDNSRFSDHNAGFNRHRL